MNFVLLVSLMAGGLFLGMMLCLEAGWYIGRRRVARDPEGLAKGVGAMEGAVLGFLGLLVAFSFSGATARFDARRQLMANQAGAIGTAYLRVSLLPAAAQPEIRDLFRRYLDLQLVMFRNVADIEATKARYVEVQALQGQLWDKAVLACRRADGAGDAAGLVLPAFNEMFGALTAQAVALMNHPPLVILGLVMVACFLSSLLAGYGMAGSRGRSWLHMLAFSATISIAAFVIVNLEYPRLGLIHVDAADHYLAAVRQSMK